MFSFIFTLAIVGVFAWFVYHFVVKFKEAEGSVWGRTLAGARDSATVFWGGVLYVAGAIVDLAEKAADFLNLPEVTTFINNYFPPKYVAIGLMVIGGVTILARLRTLFRGA